MNDNDISAVLRWTFYTFVVSRARHEGPVIVDHCAQTDWENIFLLFAKIGLLHRGVPWFAPDDTYLFTERNHQLPMSDRLRWAEDSLSGDDRDELVRLFFDLLNYGADPEKGGHGISLRRARFYPKRKEDRCLAEAFVRSEWMTRNEEGYAWSDSVRFLMRQAYIWDENDETSGDRSDRDRARVRAALGPLVYQFLDHQGQERTAQNILPVVKYLIEKEAVPQSVTALEGIGTIEPLRSLRLSSYLADE